MVIKLKLKSQPEFITEVECISPDNFAGKKIDEIKNLTVYFGNRERKLSEFFDVTGKTGKTAEETSIEIEGDCSLIYRIGQKMTAGMVTVNGNVGFHLGSEITGGKIIVNGNAGSWAGAMMDGGEIVINGDAGNHCAGAYRGNWIGMKDGKITVTGRVGVESGSWMRATRSRKKYPVLTVGSADYFLGVHNHGGTIICEGDTEGRTGGDMSHGQIIVKGKVKSMLPSFKKLGDKNEFATPAGTIKGDFVEYAGDYAVSGKPNGRLYVAK
jgi:formylmethanofuran dehydrogenase subunit C